MTMCAAPFLIPIIEYLAKKIKFHSEIGIIAYFVHVVSFFGNISGLSLFSSHQAISRPNSKNFRHSLCWYLFSYCL